MASSTTCASAGLRENGRSYATRSRRSLVNANTSSIMNRIQNRRSRGDDCLLANSFGAEGTDRRRIFDQDRLNWGNVTRGRNQIVMKIFALPRKKFFHQRHAQSLRNAALDLTFNQSGIDRASDVMGGGHLQHTNRAQFNIDFDLRHVRAET